MELNSIKSRPPDFSKTTYRLWLAMRDCKIGKLGYEQRYLLPGMSRQSPNWHSQFLTRLKKSDTDKKIYGVVIGKLVSLVKAQYGYCYTVNSLGALLYVDDALQSKLATSFPQAFQAVAQSLVLTYSLLLKLKSPPVAT